MTAETYKSWPLGELPSDVAKQHIVEDAIRNGAILPKWGWPTPVPYNGATGDARIRGWQITWLATRLGLVAHAQACSICGRTTDLHQHSELYGRPLLAKAICKSTHFRIHRRFKSPTRWREFISGQSRETWLHRIPVVELTRSEAQALERTENPLGLLDP